MREIMSSTHDWACDAFKRELELDLDDPSCLSKEDVELLYEVSADLGLDMDGLINELGSEYEAERFREKFDL
jgi:hypothetical protein